MKKLFSIITPVWNQVRTTNAFLLEIRHHLHAQHELIIINNGSTDRTQILLESWKKHLGDRLKIIVNGKNCGFGPATNQGIKASSAPFLLLLNNDVGILSSPFKAILGALGDGVRKMVCGKLVDWDGGWNKLGDQIIPYCEGWCLGISRALWDELGGFDERFIPCDYEDIDLSHRAQLADIELVELELPLYHMGGSTGSALGNRLEITKTNRRRFKEKWRSPR